MSGKNAGLRVPKNPLLLTGGSEPHNKPHIYDGNLDLSQSENYINCSVDALSFTLPEEFSQTLVKETSFVNDGYPTQGFKMSEARMIDGQTCFRKMMPTQKSKAYGSGYESWEFTGGSSHHAFDICRELDGYPTRFDTATDYACHEHETTCYLRKFMMKNFDENRVWIDAQMQGKLNEMTYYLPTWEAEKYFRVYRKDIRSPGYCEDYGYAHIMRFESQLGGEWAKRAWNKAKQNKYAECSSWHAMQLMNIRLHEEYIPPCPREKEPAVTEAKKIYEFVKQYSRRMVECDELGIPLLAFARKREKFKKKVKSSESRSRASKRRIREIGVSSINREVMKLLGFDMFEREAGKPMPSVEQIRSMFNGMIGCDPVDMNELIEQFKDLLDEDL